MSSSIVEIIKKRSGRKIGGSENPNKPKPSNNSHPHSGNHHS